MISIGFSSNELLERNEGFAVTHRFRGCFIFAKAKMRVERPADVSIECQLGAAVSMTTPDGVRRVFNRESRLEVHGNVAEAVPFAKKADLVVVLPGHVVGGADVNVLVREVNRWSR